MKKILGIVPKRSAVTIYRVIRPLEKIGGKVRFSLLRKNEKIKPLELAKRLKKQGDIWIFKYIEDLNTANLIVWMRDHVKSKLVVDIDDNIWQIQDDSIIINTEKDMTAHARRGLWTMEMIKAANAVTVSTRPMKNLLNKFNDTIAVLPNLIDPKDWKFKRKKHDKVIIGWVYSHTHFPDVKEIKGALNEVKKKYGDKIEIVIFGSDLQVFDFKPEHHWGVKFKDYPKRLTELSFDISICPLEDNAFNRCKSNIKWMESTMAGAAVVASDVTPYSDSIQHGKTGYIANSKGQWVRYISGLVEDEKLRKSMIREAKKDILKNYTSFDKWDKFYKCL